MNVFVSVGEAVDKLSILELKYKKIVDENKRIEIKKEIECLDRRSFEPGQCPVVKSSLGQPPEELNRDNVPHELFNGINQCEKYKNYYPFFYKLLLYINEKIWVMTDKIKSIKPDADTLDTCIYFAKLSSLIFDYNQKRFRIKNWFNILVNSELKEQKSYGSTYCNIKFTSEEDVLNKIPEINYLLLEYDIVFIEKSHYEVFTNIFKQPTIFLERQQKDVEEILLNDFTIPRANPILQELFPDEIVSEIFEFETIKYLAGGMFGDFIHQLSVINEKFYKTGRRGELYISNHGGGDPFKFSLEYTYNDTFGIIQKQRYIKNYKIYSGEHFDINLNDWRRIFRDPNVYGHNDPTVYGHNQGWHVSFKEIYDVEWGKHRWINTPIDEKWKDKVLINTVSYRFCDFIDFNKLLKEHNNNLIFVFSNKCGMVDYDNFVQKTNIRLPYLVIDNFEEMCTIINSCKLFIGSRSGALTIAHATHVPQIIGTDSSNPEPKTVTDLVDIWDFVKINYV